MVIGCLRVLLFHLIGLIFIINSSNKYVSIIEMKLFQSYKFHLWNDKIV
ncbi:MAG: hypothetical protein TRG1_979 [Flavobacteriaceae bacterium FS1-H7996/R]|nr:MAG: hypothetical protein TRG1_979 [Flavobacteriaceae bacterium FS1-H7996/R]